MKKKTLFQFSSAIFHKIKSYSITALLLMFLLCNYNGYSQTLYFQLNDNAEKPSIKNDVVEFKQKEIQGIAKGKNVKAVLRNPERYHSKYAKILSRTFQLYLPSIPQNEKANIEQRLRNARGIQLVEVAPEPILLCPSNDPIDAAWNLSRHEITCVQEAHCITQGDPAISIAVRDNGFIAGHPEHIGQVVFAEVGAYDGDCHGTQTSISAAGATNDGFGLSSSGYDCSLMLYRWGADFVQDYEDLTARGARVVTNSYINACTPIVAHQNVVNFVTDMGVIVVGSAGNGNAVGCGGVDDNDPTYPSAYDNVISVSSVTNLLCTETTYNFHTRPIPFDPPLHHTHNNTVDLLAQGYAVYTGNCNGGTHEIAYGTSIAGPHVAGIIGLILSVNPCLNHDDVLDILQSTGQDVTGVCNNATWYPNGAPPVPCAEDAVLMAQNYIGPDLIIDTNTDWDQKFVSGNVIIQSGATLTIHGIASMATNSRIIVERNAELIVDGGVLTSCDDEWKGIVVEGNSNLSQQLPGDPKDSNRNGIVHFLNGALAENARTLVSMDPSHLSWPTSADHYGGLIIAENTTFQNNIVRAVAFMSYAQQENSSFTNCTFIGHENGATHWNNFGTTYEDCIFDDYEDHALLVYDGQIIVHGSSFDSEGQTQFDQSAIDLFQTYPIPQGSQIGMDGEDSNQFTGGIRSVFSDGGSPNTPIIVENNDFIGSTWAIEFDGISTHHITNNTFTGGFAACTFVDNGSNPNIQDNNEFNNVSIGIYAYRNNSGYEFLRNCFDINTASYFRDVYIYEGPIVSAVGNGNNAASNLFSMSTAQRGIYLAGGAPVFDYHILTGTPATDRTVPLDLSGNPYSGNVFDANFSENCGTSNFTSTTNTAKSRNNENETECNIPKPKGQLIASMKGLEKDLAALEAIIKDTPNEHANEKAKLRWEIKETKRCLHYSKVNLIQLGGNAKEYEDLIDKFKEDKFIYKSVIYGTMTSNRDYKVAKDYIKSLSLENEEDDDFVNTQLITLICDDFYTLHSKASKIFFCAFFSVTILLQRIFSFFRCKSTRYAVCNSSKAVVALIPSDLTLALI